jgi:hypothetical protein
MQCNVMQGYVNTFFAPNITMWVFVFFLRWPPPPPPPSILPRLLPSFYLNSLCQLVSTHLLYLNFCLSAPLDQLPFINFSLSNFLSQLSINSSLPTQRDQLGSINSSLRRCVSPFEDEHGFEKLPNTIQHTRRFIRHRIYIGMRVLDR